MKKNWIEKIGKFLSHSIFIDYFPFQISDNGVISLDFSFLGGALDSYTADKPWLAPYGADVGR